MIANKPELKGTLAARKELHGPLSRFAIAPLHTRFEAVQWFVWDANILDDTGHAEAIGQFDDETEARAYLRGLISKAENELDDFYA